MTMRLTYIEVDLSMIGQNLAHVRTLVSPDVKIMGVVKANAYGHGMVEVARYLEKRGVDILGVALVQEAVVLRNAGITKPILVFYGATVDEFPLYASYDFIITVSSLAGAEALQDYMSTVRSQIQVHMKTDTGMGRIGVRYTEAAALAEKIAGLPNLILSGLYSHLATSEGDDPEYVSLQTERFNSVAGEMKRRGIEVEHIHLANSGGILNYPETHGTLVRPGIMLYGYPPGTHTVNSNALRPALSLRSRIGFLKEAGPGVSISYGRRFTTSKPTRIGTVPIGYGDGYNRLLTNKASVLVHGKRYPVVGTVCMDQIMLDLGSADPVEVGDEVTLIGTDGGETIDASELGRLTGTIPYEVLCALSARVPRIYRG
jgi:alanine racemase